MHENLDLKKIFQIKNIKKCNRNININNCVLYLKIPNGLDQNKSFIKYIFSTRIKLKEDLFFFPILFS